MTGYRHEAYLSESNRHIASLATRELCSAHGLQDEGSQTTAAPSPAYTDKAF